MSDISGTAAAIKDTKEQPPKRPEMPPDIESAVNEHWSRTDNQVQRANALFEYREANKTLFPARFNPNDPRRGQTPRELKNGKDTRRVQTPYIYRGGLQITAMSVPEDFAFHFEAREQVKAPAPPGMQQTEAPDPVITTFASTLTITMQQLLEEANFVPKLQAWVQDSSFFPCAVLKGTFRREYNTASLNSNPGSKDETDAMARLESLATQFATKQITDQDPAFSELKDLLTTMKAKARITRWYGLDLQLIPMDAFGISEECTDLVNVYDAPFMWHDALLSGEEILRKYPYKPAEEPEGESFGVLLEELNSASPWDTTNSSTDPNARNRSSRNKQLTAPKATPINTVSTTSSSGTDPKKRQYLVREIWSKRDRMVYTLIRGLKHYVDKFIPQKTSERWYPFAILAPNRVPTEVYAASDLELKRDIQDRIHRKRTDEEKARFLHLPRGIFNRAGCTDEKEMVKLQDVPPGQLKGINFGTTQMKIDDMVQWWKYDYDPASFDTTKDEQDMDQMGALPVQSMGATGSANFATEVSVAAAGSNVATNFRKGIIKTAIEGFLTALAEVFLQELTADEVRRIAGTFALWPELYDEVEAAQIVEEAKARAAQTAMPQILPLVVQQLQAGIPPDEQQLQATIDAASTPIWQAEMMAKYGNIEPVTRESLYRRLKVKIKSTFNSRLDKQQNLAMFGQLGEACMQMGQAAQGLGTPFVMRPILMHHADLIGGAAVVDEAFPAISPMEIAKNLATQALANAAGPQGGPNGPPGPAGKGPAPSGPQNPNAQGPQGAKVEPAGQAANALQSAPAPMG
jgi:hypothetical protein